MSKTRYAVPLVVAVLFLVFVVLALHGGYVDHTTLYHLAEPLGAATASLRALQEKAAGIGAELRAILDKAEAEDRDLSAEEQTAYDGLKAQHATLRTRIERLQEQAGREAAADVVQPGVGRRQGIERAPGEARTQFASIGEFMAAVRFNPNDPRLTYVEDASANVETGQRAEMRMDDGPSGGFAIPPQFRDTLLRLTPQQALIRPRAQVIPAGSPPDAPITIPALDQSGPAPGNWFGGVQVAWVGEGGLKPATDAKLREITLTPHEVAGTIIVTDKLLRNWGAASALLEAQLRGAVAQAEDLAFLGGNGIAKPLGYLRSSALYRVPRQSASSVTYDDCANMVVRFYGQQGWFVYSRSMLGALMRLKDTQGRPLWLPSVREGEPATLLGYPAVENNRNPALGFLGDLQLVDFGQYLIKDGSGPFVAASEHVLFQSNKTMIKIFWNVDGSPWLQAPFALENGDIVSPFVALDVPAV